MASRTFAVVSAEQARSEPYPYVFVTDDGSVRELHVEERRFLETPFDPCDGARPHVKSGYTDRDGWGSLAGFCRRATIPRRLAVAPAPPENPNPPLSRAQWIEWLKHKTGAAVTERPDGTVVVEWPET